MTPERIETARKKAREFVLENDRSINITAWDKSMDVFVNELTRENENE